VLGDKLYVAGGWELAGGTNTPVWPDTSFVLDLQNPGSGWKSFPQPFQRRALALAAVDGRVYCIGGMNSSNAPSLAVDVYDVASGNWSKGPDLPSGRWKGFGCSAIAQDGRVYVTAFKGDLLRLSANGTAWEIVGRLENPRMAHRLVTAGQTQLIALGGEDGEEDKLRDLELLTPSSAPLPDEKAHEPESAASRTH
jgi:N-acetylneuraminic acid mutarotase